MKSDKITLFKLSGLLLFALSCQTEQKIDCDVVSMQRYKGIPNSSLSFEKHCQGIQVKYTRESCQSALVELMRTNSLAAVKKDFGDPIEHCFTGEDLKRFNTK